MRQGSRSTLVIALLAAAAVVLLLVWSSANGTPLVSAPQGTWGPPRAETGAATPTVELQIPTAAPDGAGDRAPTVSTDTMVNVIFGLFLMAVVTAFLLALRWLGRQRYEEQHRQGIAAEDELVALLEATNEDTQFRALSEGDPRNGVVACWVALEEAVQRSGLSRNRSETAAELTERVLSRWEVDAEAITTLSHAYREARFSRHPITDDQRDAAVHALDRIHTDLRRRVQAEDEARAAQERDAAQAAAAAEQAKTDAALARSSRRRSRGA
ncbi:MAG: DUF4129 domain-containing protein [Ornithinimicrobium sp.]|uniref:DUF4129 domain-containing protein n=1 Tax=Ornithinimicrobium sp. TaxID=1977084 RepID=UPI0026DF449C|nr:DUF4129 domain-containing protein [Ornithinimicrobium sp.]MDO5738959.1 DUF4129 domain-containing protein [Ornithinimicrobium sp.]